ncbi:MAG TPA: GntR family transcriptional regulator [Ramlibacter sp.]
MAEAPQPLYARLRDQLRAGILDGRLQPNARLPSEAEMTAAYGVSRITVRQALGDLQREGLIVRLQGKGAFVSQPRASQQLDRLEGLGEALAGQGQTVHSKRLAMKQVRAPAAVAAQLELPARTELFQLTTLRYLERQPLSVNSSWFAPGLGERLARIDVSGRDLIDVLERDLAQRVQGAEVEIRAEAMAGREARLLRVEAGQPALRVHRLVRAVGGRPLQTETAIYRADIFSYKLALRR